jgi:hypothetical protein
MAKKKETKKTTNSLKKIIKAKKSKVKVTKKTEQVKELTPKVVEVVTDGYEPEANNSGAPKVFMIRCAKCRWGRVSSGVSVDITDLIEVKSNCASCGKWRKFKCPKCGKTCSMKRIQGNT